jgi:peptidoglycan/LPS O-acetylase OafA/YrhL
MAIHWSVVLLVSLPLALALAALSYHFIEHPVLKDQVPFRLPRPTASYAIGGTDAIRTKPGIVRQI